MIRAFVFIEAEPTRVQELVPELAGMKLASSVIKEVHALTGRYDLMFEVVADDDEELLRLLSRLRSRDDVVEAEAFVCLKLFKQTFAWGAR